MKELKYISTDVEYSGESKEKLGQGSLLSIGSCEMGNINNNFYRELKPINNIYSDEAIQVIKNGFKTIGNDVDSLSSSEVLNRLYDFGVDPKEAFTLYKGWLEKFGKVMLNEIACPIKFDGGLTSYYFREYAGKNPLGFSGEDGNSLLRGFLNDTNMSLKRLGIKGLNEELPHNALQDAQIQSTFIEFLLQLINENKKCKGELSSIYLSHGKEDFLNSEIVKKYVEWVEDTVSAIKSTPFGNSINYKSILSV